MRSKIYTAALSLMLVLVACSFDLPHPRYQRQPTSALLPVPFPPPPARVEYVPTEPKNEGVVWVDGEWEWKGRSWSWKRGRWVVPPSADAQFSPWTTVRSGDGMLYIAQGTWRSPNGQAIAAPAAIAYGKPTAGAIVDSEGVSEHTGKSIKEDTTDEAPLPDGGVRIETKEQKKAQKAEKKAEKAEQKKEIVPTDKDKNGDGIDDDLE
ncbi:MAG: YXWGXW repeat-containing protein [Polyangiaceae bacterium]